MVKPEEILKTEFESIKKDLIDKHNELGMKASGKWEESLEVFIEASKGRVKAILYGLNYTEQLQFGRKPGKFPPIKEIEAWIYHKGISFVEKDIKLKQLAFLIARKIAREGTKYFKQGGTELVSSIVTPDRFDKILRKLNEVNINIFTNTLIDNYKKLAA